MGCISSSRAGEGRRRRRGEGELMRGVVVVGIPLRRHRIATILSSAIGVLAPRPSPPLRCRAAGTQFTHLPTLCGRRPRQHRRPSLLRLPYLPPFPNRKTQKPDRPNPDQSDFRLILYILGWVAEKACACHNSDKVKRFLEIQKPRENKKEYDPSTAISLLKETNK
ncbi:hypothetical protein NL676_013482 [Syzygium grande]|nr:hypothetical protein NL676_013482 [Syzygium grande]